MNNLQASKLRRSNGMPNPIETTNNFTRTKKDDARYWSCDVTFGYKEYSSRVLKMSQCRIPYVRGEGYGTDFVYATFKKAIGDAIIKADNRINFTVISADERLASTAETWQKRLNKIKGCISARDKNGDFQPRDYHTIKPKTGLGARGTVDSMFKPKASSPEGSPKNARTTFSINADCSGISIREINQDIEPPYRGFDQAYHSSPPN